jgi:hypothetical protein
VLTCWRISVAESSAKWQQLARALCFHKNKLQAVALQAWQQAAEQQQQARAAAADRLQAWQLQMLRCTAAEALRDWLEVAREQKELRKLAGQLLHIVQRQRKHQVRFRCTLHAAQCYGTILPVCVALLQVNCCSNS